MAGLVTTLKRIVIRVLFVWVLIVIAWVIINWWFLLLFGKAIWTFNRPWRADWAVAFFVTILLVIILPALYIWSIKAWLLLTALGAMRWSYRDRLAVTMIDAIAPAVTGSSQQGIAVAEQVHASLSQWKEDLPRSMRLLMDSLLDRVPLLGSLISATQSLDAKSFTDEKTFKQEMYTAMQPYLEKTSVSGSGWWILLFGLLIANILLLVGIYLLIV